MSEVVYVGFGQRFIAFLIDNVVVALLLLPLAFAVPIDPAIMSSGDPVKMLQALREALPDMSLKLVLTSVLFMLSWSFLASTPGKLAFKGYIVRADTHKTASTTQLVIRYLGYFVSMATFGIGFLMIGFDKRKQGLHDKLAGTVVIKQKPVE